MLQFDWNRIRDILRTDLITMRGGKNNSRTAVAAIMLLFGALGFVFSTLIGLYVPLIVGGFFVPMLFQNEMKYHCEKMYALLPVPRKTLVQSRFLLTIGLYLAVNLVYYLLMLLSLRLQLWNVVMGEGGEYLDILSLIAKRMGISTLGLFHVCYALVTAAGLWSAASSLRKYFKDSSRLTTSLNLTNMRKAGKGEYVLAGIIFGVLILWALILTDTLPLGTAAAVVIALMQQLITIGDGILFVLMMLLIGMMMGVYHYICTILEFEDKEL